MDCDFPSWCWLSWWWPVLFIDCPVIVAIIGVAIYAAISEIWKEK